jgi:hypothetical protein
MVQGNTSTSFASLLKRLYTKETVADETYKDNPLYTMLPKKEDTSGADYTVPVIYSQGQGRSHTFTSAQAVGNVSGTQSAAFRQALVENWADASISSALILQSGNSEGAFLKAQMQVVPGQLANLGKTLEFECFGGGPYGQIAAGSSVSLASGTITFAVPQQAFNFEEGMQIVAAPTNSGTVTTRTPGSALGGSGSAGANYLAATVGQVDRNAGTITIYTPAGVAVAANDSTNGISAALAAGDYLYAVGDVSTTGNILSITGVTSWIPYGGPAATGDSFTLNAINRAVDPVRLAGLWYNASTVDTVQALITGAAKVAEQGDHISHYFMTHMKFAALASSLVSKVSITDLRATPGVGFQSIDVVGTNGPIKVVPARACPPTTVLGLKLSEWELASFRKAVFNWDLDNNTELRQATDGGIEFRFYSFANLWCHKPSANINMLVPAA